MAGNRLRPTGTFYGVGVGPGDKELLTLKAIKTIKAADVIIAPKTEKKEGSVALSIAEDYIGENARIVYQVFPMVKNFAQSSREWRQNKEEILGFLEDGKNVVFLTLGDPMFYSTYIYMFKMLKGTANIVTVPGITAFTAIGSACDYPIVEGNEILAVIPATADKDKIDRALKAADRAVLMKVYHNFAEIADLLQENDMAKNAVMSSRCGLDEEKLITDIASRKNDKVNYLSTILTGKEGSDEHEE